MRQLRKKYTTFLLRNRDKGIPKLMLWIGLANMAVYLICLLGTVMASGSAFSNAAVNLYDWLCYDATLILKGQVWRMFSFLLTYLSDVSGTAFYGVLIAAINVLFYYWLGSVLESSMGRLRMNIYYFSGVLMLGLAGVLLELFFPGSGSLFGSYVSAAYINISMFIAVATLIPDERVYLFMIIPVRMRWLALLDLVLMTIEIGGGVLNAVGLGSYYGVKIFWVGMLYAQFPLIGLANYFLHFGRNVSRLFRRSGAPQTRRRQQPPIQAVPNPSRATDGTGTQRPYRHKCTVCGRTDTDYPDLEFRYCSKCKGYFCYCIDHINNHTHIT